MKEIFEKSVLIRSYFYNHQLRVVLYFGVLLRVIVFIFQSPFNRDNHFGVVQYIHYFHSIPFSGLLSQSEHPPLYYVLASLFSPGGAKAVQAFSLILSIGTLVVIYQLVKNLEFIQPLRAKKACLLLACTLPQFIFFGNYISNDTLSFLIGALIFLQIFKYINRPNKINRNILAIYLGLGLLTKGSFLLFIPVLMLLIILISAKEGAGLRQSIVFLLVFIAIFLTVGSYKGVENIVLRGRPVVMNVDIEPLVRRSQPPAYAGLKSLYDINILKLCRYPIVSKHTKFSFPLLLYGTFWYQYTPQPHFGESGVKFKYLGSLIYILAVLPTLLFFTGFTRILFSIKAMFSQEGADRLSFNKIAYEAVTLFLLFSNMLVIAYLEFKYDSWSCFQSRYLFPSFFSIIILYNSGLNCIERTPALAQRVVYPLLKCLYWLFLLHFGLEIIARG